MRFGSIAFALLLVACNKSEPPAASTSTATSTATPSAAVIGTAEVGKPAPDFALKDLDGKEVRLSSFKGKVVVLEWFNPGCPFVKKSHTKGSLVDTAKRQTKNGVVWLAINSAAAGKQGSGADVNREAAKKYGMEHPILLDEAGDVGRAYGATNTPHMMVIDGNGTLVYRGAVDNSPDGERESPTDGKLVVYVDEAVAAATAGKMPATTETKAYGCSVKFASK